MPVYPIYIQYSKFNKHQCGIYISGINNISIERDTFEFNPRFYFQYHGADTLYGLYLDNCTGFSVQKTKSIEKTRIRLISG